LEVPRLAEEIRFVGGQQVHHLLQLCLARRAGDQLVIVAVATQLVMAQAPPQPPYQQGAFAVAHADSGDLVDQLLELRILGVGDIDAVVEAWNGHCLTSHGWWMRLWMISSALLSIEA